MQDIPCRFWHNFGEVAHLKLNVWIGYALADDRCDTIPAHRHTVKGISDLHCAFLVSDDDQLGIFPQLVELI